MKKLIFPIILLFTIESFAQKNHPEPFKCSRESSFKGDINLYYNPLLDHYDIHFAKLDIEVSDQSTYISGNATLQAKVVELLDTLIFDFCSYMSVDSVLIDDKKVSFNHSNDIIQYIFDSPLTTDESFKAQIFYHGTPVGAGVTNGYNSTWNKYVTWTLSESFHAYEWWPCKQVLSDKIDSTYIFLTCDADCKAGSNGLLTSVVDLPNNKKRFEWKSYYPINYYLISFAVSDYQEYNIYANPSGSDSILIQNYIYNSSECLDYYKSDIGQTIDFLELFSEKFGLYPFANEKYGHCLTELGGGMEHQTMTTIGNFGYTLVAHELGHMWFGDHVTCATWQDIWINEGFASYTEYVALENLQAASSAQNWMSDAHTYAIDEPHGSVYIPFEDAFNENRIFNYALSYKKGAAILHTIRHQINNDELFFLAISDYLIMYGDSVATGDDFKNAMESNTGIDFDSFFNQWYYGQGYPQFNVEYSQQNDTLFLTVNQVTSSTETPLFQLFVDYKISFSDSDTTLRLYQPENTESFKIPVLKEVINITVDPDNWILDTPGTVQNISTIINDNVFKISPNPASEELTVKFNMKFHGKEKTIEIFDINGKLIKTCISDLDEITLDVSLLTNGIYIIKAKSLDKQNAYKFIKQ